MVKKRRRKSRPLFFAAAGAVALSYAGCNEPKLIGNPKRPPDLGIDMAVPPPADMAKPPQND